jgi:hypothetical protein
VRCGVDAPVFEDVPVEGVRLAGADEIVEMPVADDVDVVGDVVDDRPPRGAAAEAAAATFSAPCLSASATSGSMSRVICGMRLTSM